MQNIKRKLSETFKNKEFNRYIEIFDDYINEGNAIDYNSIVYYVIVLTRLKEYDKAYAIVKFLEKDIDKYDITLDLAKLYLYCYKPEDALRVFFKNEDNINRGDILLIKIYLLQGKFDEAYIFISNCLKKDMNDYNLSRVNYYRNILDNHYEKGAYIETEYSSFISNGNSLEPGHIVFLKSNPDSNDNIENDYKSSNRPYMIWKIENDKIYLFPVTNTYKRNSYRLYYEKYPNSVGDRSIKDNLCFTNFDNILSVQDKVLDADFNVILKSIFLTTYYGSSKSEKEAREEFLTSYVVKPDIYDVIEFVEPSSKKHYFYFVLDSNYDGFEVIEVDSGYKPLSNMRELFKRDRLIFRTYKLSDECKKEVLHEIPDFIRVKCLNGRKVIVGGIKYIVVYENNDTCICINEIYSPSYIFPFEIKREDITSIDSEISSSELSKIRSLMEEENVLKKNKSKTKVMLKGKDRSKSNGII